MDDEYTYDEKFEDNIPIIGQTACRKTTFIQKLVKKQNVWKLKRNILDHKSTTFWSKRKKIVSCFQKHVDFKYPQTVDEFNIELTFFKDKKMYIMIL